MLSKEEYLRSVWRVVFDLRLPNSKVPAIQWALFKNDPYELFRSGIAESPHVSKEFLEIDSSADKEFTTHKQVAITGSWDSMFHHIPGDKVNLLVSHPQLGSSMASNESVERIWIATKVHKQQFSPVAWAFELHPKVGDEIKLKLTENNCLDLGALFLQYLREILEDSGLI
jgi:hypothetical protein